MRGFLVHTNRHTKRIQIKAVHIGATTILSAWEYLWEYMGWNIYGKTCRWIQKSKDLRKILHSIKMTCQIDAWVVSSGFLRLQHATVIKTIKVLFMQCNDFEAFAAFLMQSTKAVSCIFPDFPQYSCSNAASCVYASFNLIAEILRSKQMLLLTTLKVSFVFFIPLLYPSNISASCHCDSLSGFRATYAAIHLQRYPVATIAKRTLRISGSLIVLHFFALRSSPIRLLNYINSCFIA